LVAPFVHWHGRWPLGLLCAGFAPIFSAISFIPLADDAEAPGVPTWLLHDAAVRKCFPTQAWNERSLAGLAAKARTLRHRTLRQPVPRAPKPLPSARLGRAYLMPVRTGLHLLIRFSYRERGARASVQLPVSNTTGSLPALSSANPGRADRTAPTSRPEGDLEASCDARRRMEGVVPRFAQEARVAEELGIAGTVDV